MNPNAPRRRLGDILLPVLMATALVAWPHGLGAIRADAQSARQTVRVVTDAAGSRLQVDGRDFLVRGMNWDYIPIGQNYAFNLWQQPDEVVREAVDREMSLLAAMGVNAIRISTGVPPRWISYIHERYGIYSIINHYVGRYGATLDGVWHPTIDYSDARMRRMLAAEVAAMVQTYRTCPGVLMYLLGNENNYALSWSSFEIEALPQGERDVARARHLYSLMGEIARAAKVADPAVPVALANGDVQYIDVIASECQGLDIFGTNVYRGISSGDLFQVVRAKLGLPVMYTEFGSDAFNARAGREDQAMQARYLIGLWREVYDNSAGHTGVGNAIGGCVFQWSDGWWKYKQEERLDVHDTNASWPDGGYVEDYAKGENNMNEEWWGICAKGLPDGRGLYELHPRAAYYALRAVFRLDPYASATTSATIAAHFAAITPAAAQLEAGGSTAALTTQALARARLAGLRLNCETVSTGARRTRPPQAGDPEFTGFDRMQSFFVDFQADPSPAVTGRLSLNIRGHVPTNPIDQIFYENRSPDRVKVYQSSVSWDDRWFGLDAFYRTGHFHWGYEGDFFGLYREAHYGANVDLYDSEAPVGVEVTGKRALAGVKAAFGPQLWWGAPPAGLIKARRQFGSIDATAMYERDIAGTGAFTVVGSSIVALRPTQKATLQLKTTRGSLVLEAGGIWAGANHRGDVFPVSSGSGDGYRLLRDRVRRADEYGAKIRVSSGTGPVQWYLQGAAMGLVADGGPTAVNNLMAWSLKDCGSGNQRNVIGGFAWRLGSFQVGPNFLWQKPIVGPLANDERNQGIQRDILGNPFSVRANREMTGAEVMLAWDPTPATWLFAWDNDVREDARLAGSLGLVFRHRPTSMDAANGFLADGITPFVFDGATPASDLWEANLRTVSRLSPRLRLAAHAFCGTAEPNLAPDPRRVRRAGGDLRLAGGSNAVTASAKFNDFGPYDYFRDFNLTYPVQLVGDIAHTLGTPAWFYNQPQSQVGLRATWRALDQYSLRYLGFPADPWGSEWEIRTYIRLAM